MDTQQFEEIRPKCAGLDVHKNQLSLLSALLILLP